MLPLPTSFNREREKARESSKPETTARKKRNIKERIKKICSKAVTVRTVRKVMSERKQVRNLVRFYSLKRGAQQGEMALIRAPR